MCIYNIRIDDTVMSRVRPHFKGEDAMQLWIEQQLQKVLVDYADQFDVLPSEVRNGEDIMEKLKSLDGDPDAFFKMKGILGKPKAGFSWETLREDAYLEKYRL